MRSLLFIPGHSARMMAKAAGSGADVVILDLEDAVHPDSKPAARRLVAEALANRSGATPAHYVRVNALDSVWCADDVEAVMPARPDGIMLPKPQGPEDLYRLDALMTRCELSGATTGIIAVCTETPAATLSLAAKSWIHPRLAGLLRGGEDLSAAIGTTANRDEQGRYTEPFALARNLCLLAARAAGVVPIDAVFTDFRNVDGLTREADAARRDGFSAKAAIHPAQVEIINRCFTPTDGERRWAERVLAAFEASDSGVVQIDGVMMDAPHLSQARRRHGLAFALSERQTVTSREARRFGGGALELIDHLAFGQGDRTEWHGKADILRQKFYLDLADTNFAGERMVAAIAALR